MKCTCSCCKARARRYQPQKRDQLKSIRNVQGRVVPVGELRGLIYRTQRFPYQMRKYFIHFFKGQYPVLVTNTRGTRLYIAGGGYRVTSRGIEG